jgi:tetratricopeptide (TPR) repeat protein
MAGTAHVLRAGVGGQRRRAAFRHALTRDAAYAAVPWSRRRALHQAIAGHLADGHAPPALIAGHLLAARDLAAARAALIAAAAADCAVHAYRDAARALRTALDLWPPGREDAERLAVVDQLARCAEMCAEHAEAVTLLRELADGYRASAAQDNLGGVQRRLALAHELLGQWDAALAAREAAAVAFATAGRPAEAAVERLAAASHLRSAASFAAALDTLVAARSDADAAGRADLLLRIDGLHGNVLARMGRTREGIAAVRAALDAALAQALTGPAAELHQRLADSLEHAGEYHTAIATYAAGYEFCQAHGEQAAGQLCRACVTAVLFVAGHWDRALEVCADAAGAEGALAHARAVGTGIGGLIHAFRGSAATARRELLAATSLAARIELTPMELLSAWGLCVLDDAAGGQAEAAARARRILARWEETGERHYSIAILQWSSTLFAESGDPAGARACAAALARIAEATAQPEALARWRTPSVRRRTSTASPAPPRRNCCARRSRLALSACRWQARWLSAGRRRPWPERARRRVPPISCARRTRSSPAGGEPGCRAVRCGARRLGQEAPRAGPGTPAGRPEPPGA